MTRIILILLAALLCANAGAAAALGFYGLLPAGDAFLLALFSTGCAVLAGIECEEAI